MQNFKNVLVFEVQPSSRAYDGCFFAMLQERLGLHEPLSRSNNSTDVIYAEFKVSYNEVG